MSTIYVFIIMPFTGGCDSKTLPWMIMAVVVVALMVVLYYSCWAVSSSAAASTAEKFNYMGYLPKEQMLNYEHVRNYDNMRNYEKMLNYENFDYMKYMGKEGAVNKDVGPNDLQNMLY